MKMRISAWQVFLLVFITSFCVTPFGFAPLHPELNRHMWVASLAQFAVTMTGTTGVWLLWRRFPQQPLAGILRRVIGPFTTRIYLILLAIYLLFWGPVGNQVTLLKMTQATLLPVTTPYAIAGLMLLTAAYAAYFGPEVVGRVCEAWAYLVLPSLLYLVFVPMVNSDPGMLFPLTGIPFEPIMRPEFWSFAIGLRGFILLLALFGTLPDDRYLRPAVFWGSGLSALAVSIMVLIPHTIFGPATVGLFQFPVLEVMDSIRMVSVGIQSFLAVTMVIWYIVGWAVAASSLYGTAILVSQALGLTSYRTLLLPLIMFAVLAVGYPKPLPLQILLTNLWSALGYLVGVVAPWLFIAISAIRRIRQGAAAV